MNSTAPRCVWEVQATLGEGVLWHASRDCVYFVDIKGKQIHRCSPDGSVRRSWSAPSQVSFIVPVEGGGLVCGLEDGLYRFIEESGEFVPLRQVESDLPGNRFNDGHVDAAGRLWFGSMDNAEAMPSGVLYRFDGAGAAHAMGTGYVITNGPAISPDGRTLYHTDTLDKVIYAFDMAPDGGLSNKRVFVTIEGGGYPDGMAVDVDGNLWVCTFGGWRIDRFDAQGTKTGTIAFPCSNITKLAFGGNDLRTVFVTTARKGLSQEELAAQPLAGALFTFRSDTPGLPQHALRLQE
ncbi:SMP-30/gluconolactonase/LRE family protein [Massilia horti]|uniref:SMP-30/gluconolactonase/LRE family protein n=1 Tax=Massilia horti TaxID=2562153 RepID=A0A4Y9SUN0_9BURK|nr:SMP-30/gluconolactonase/LRE family protein [Massilia horti]TFW30512.1 SMP-30/gluconolactonase/LRE family protein [Massilia horti]TFW30569.1 SMP-30/gluconolactonase/LRE family protein [Massilia horti]